MDITFLGHASFRINGREASVVTDPFDSKKVGLKFSKVGADIVTVSHDHFDHNCIDNVSDVHMVIDGPGEYEVKGVSVVGFLSFHDNKKGELRGKNTIYLIEIDDLRIVHLGDLGHKLSEKQLGSLGDVDILMIPIGGEYTIGSQEAVEIVKVIEPKITMPMHYQMPGLDQKSFAKLALPDVFLSELGLPVEKLAKLVVKKEILGEEKKIVLLEKK